MATLKQMKSMEALIRVALQTHHPNIREWISQEAAKSYHQLTMIGLIIALLTIFVAQFMIVGIRESTPGNILSIALPLSGVLIALLIGTIMMFSFANSQKKFMCMRGKQNDRKPNTSD